MRELDSEEGVANALFQVAVGYLQRKSWSAAAEALDEALHLCIKLDNPAGQGQVRLRLAELAAAQQDPDQALEHLATAEECFRGLEDVSGLASVLERRAGLLEQAGDLAGAAEALQQALELAQEANDELSQLLLNQYLAPLQRRLGRLDQAYESYRRLGALSQKLNEPQREALALLGVAALLAQRGEAEEAARALTGAEEIFNRLGLPRQAAKVAAERERLGKTQTTVRPRRPEREKGQEHEILEQSAVGRAGLYPDGQCGARGGHGQAGGGPQGAAGQGVLPEVHGVARRGHPHLDAQALPQLPPTMKPALIMPGNRATPRQRLSIQMGVPASGDSMNFRKDTLACCTLRSASSLSMAAAGPALAIRVKASTANSALLQNFMLLPFFPLRPPRPDGCLGLAQALAFGSHLGCLAGKAQAVEYLLGPGQGPRRLLGLAALGQQGGHPQQGQGLPLGLVQLLAQRAQAAIGLVGLVQAPQTALQGSQVLVEQQLAKLVVRLLGQFQGLLQGLRRPGQVSGLLQQAGPALQDRGQARDVLQTSEALLGRGQVLQGLVRVLLGRGQFGQAQAHLALARRIVQLDAQVQGLVQGLGRG
eukprot:TRINITY_DN71093_c0_g1_i1.p2 TRINITY_DN71093_c0_g1~~TRINITY_DN71093_c0_g1_i1.p2  ORF type:complete len:594 (-),score=226.56 TRINITY_DN71093_c0_g1_i1:622-2403(-)